MSRKFGQNNNMIDNYEKFLQKICHKCKKEGEREKNKS